MGNKQNRCEIRDPLARRGGMLMAWSENLQIKMMRSTNFCMKMLVESENETDNFWTIFVHGNTEGEISRGRRQC